MTTTTETIYVLRAIGGGECGEYADLLSARAAERRSPATYVVAYRRVWHVRPDILVAHRCPTETFASRADAEAYAATCRGTITPGRRRVHLSREEVAR